MKLAYAKLNHYVTIKTIPSFEDISLSEMQGLTFARSTFHLDNPFKWTPLIQLVDPSEDFLEFMDELKEEENCSKSSKDFKTDEKVTCEYALRSKDMVRALVEDTLQDIPGFDYMEDFYCQPSRNCKVHGKVPFMLYDKANESQNYGFPMSPVMLMNVGTDKIGNNLAYTDFPAKIGSVAHWMIIKLRNLMSQDKEFAERVKQDERLSNIRVIYTNGHMFKLWEFDIDFRARATSWYLPRTIGKVLEEANFQPFEEYSDLEEMRIWHDFKHMQLAIGLLRFAANTPDERELALQDTYEYLIDLQYMDQVSPEEKSKLRKTARLLRFLPDSIVKLLINVDPKDLNDGPSTRRSSSNESNKTSNSNTK